MNNTESCAHEPNSFSIQFTGNKAEFSGTFESKQKLEQLANVLIEALPSLEVINSGLAYDEEYRLPFPEQFENLLVEIALSTHDGELSISESEILVGGLTNSVVPIAAIKIRAAVFTNENRKLNDRMCLIPTEDLPSHPIILSTGETRAAFSFDLELEKIRHSSFEPPGFSLLKLNDLIFNTRNLYWLETGAVDDPATEVKPIVATPTATQQFTLEPIDRDNEIKNTDPFLEIGSIQFSSNSGVLQTGEEKYINTLAEELNSEPYLNQPIELKIMTYQLGSEAFSEWVAKKRKLKMIELLLSLDIDKKRIRDIYEPSSSDHDAGEVKIRVLKPE